MRVGTVAIVGRTNVGKSTFLNACLGERIAIVSPLPQTTRDDLLGVVHRPGAQIAFTDTPGFHRPKTELGRRMNQTALDSVRSHDAVVFMTDTGQGRARRRLTKDVPEELGPHDPVHPDDRRLLQLLPAETPCILVINKVDLLRDKTRLLPLLTAFNDAFNFASIVPTSLLAADGVDRVLAEVEKLLKEGAAPYTEDDITNKPMTFFVREYVREQIMHTTAREVPHAVAVSVERYEDRGKLARIQATIHVEKIGQRIIVVGHKGERIKEIGTGARLRLEELLGKQVHLELFVRVTERWKDMPRQLQELGYEGAGGRDLRSILPRDQRPPRRLRPAAAQAAGATSGQKRSSGSKHGAAKSKPRANATAKPSTSVKPHTGTTKPHTGTTKRPPAGSGSGSAASKPASKPSPRKRPHPLRSKRPARKNAS